VIDHLIMVLSLLTFVDMSIIIFILIAVTVIVYSMGAYRRHKDLKEVSRILITSKAAFRRDIEQVVENFKEELKTINNGNIVKINEHNKKVLQVTNNQVIEINNIGSTLTNIDNSLIEQIKSYERIVMLQKIIAKKNKKLELNSK